MLYIAFNTFNVYSFFFYLNYLNLNHHLSIFATNNDYNMPIHIDTPLNRHVLNFSPNLVSIDAYLVRYFYSMSKQFFFTSIAKKNATNSLSFLQLLLKFRFLKKNSLPRIKFCSKRPIFNFHTLLRTQGHS